VRTARSEHIVSASTVQVHINIARDNQPLNATRTRGKRAPTASARNRSDRSESARINANQNVVKNLAVNQRRATNSTQCG
jgi:hypothetical protein